MPHWPSAPPPGQTTVPDPTTPHQRMAITTRDSQRLAETRPIVGLPTIASVAAVRRHGVFGSMSVDRNRRHGFLQGLNRAAD